MSQFDKELLDSQWNKGYCINPNKAVEWYFGWSDKLWVKELRSNNNTWWKWKFRIF